MTPKEKANELVYKYSHLVTSWDCYWDTEIAIENRIPQMKECALISVDVMINYLIKNNITGTLMTYWQEVKQEIEKL